LLKSVRKKKPIDVNFFIVGEPVLAPETRRKPFPGGSTAESRRWRFLEQAQIPSTAIFPFTLAWL